VNLACAAATLALELLAPCRLSLRRPLQVQVGNEPPHPFGQAMLGFFDSEREQAYIAGYANISRRLGGGPLAELPRSEVFKSIVVHEIAHAAMHQNAPAAALSHVASEYLAYALQIESLPAAHRATFLQSVAGGSIDGLVFSDVMLQLDAHVFAAYAYAHLKASPDRCGRLSELVTGEADFVQPGAPF
jgi:hypothetical protein